MFKITFSPVILNKQNFKIKIEVLIKIVQQNKEVYLWFWAKLLKSNLQRVK